MINKQAITELLKTEYKDLDSAIDFQYIIDDASDLEEVREAIQSYIYESCDIIYYATAIEYLAKNDPSLRESLDLAQEIGYTADKINSELLATLLYQRELSEILGEFISDAEDIDELPDSEAA
jgi:hypothetical protein